MTYDFPGDEGPRNTVEARPMLSGREKGRYVLLPEKGHKKKSISRVLHSAGDGLCLRRGG